MERGTDTGLICALVASAQSTSSRRTVKRMRQEVEGLRSHFSKDLAQKDRLARMGETPGGSLPRSPPSRHISVCLAFHSFLRTTKTDLFHSPSFSSVEPTIDLDASRKLARLSNNPQATTILRRPLHRLGKQGSTSPSSTTGVEFSKVSSTSWIAISRGPSETRRS